jgi:intron-binding protein aquarius
LNDIFEKVVARGDLDEKCLLRLGAGERDLQVESSHDFTKAGRVAYCFRQRGLHLEQVQRLSESLGLSGKAERGDDGSPGYTCVTADYFHQQHIRRMIRNFESWTKESSDVQEISPESFPFASYFSVTHNVSLAQARKHIAEIQMLFDELAVYRPFEMLRSQKQRTDYLLMKQTRVVAMTCTHAAIARPYLIELGFEYDNVIVEEAGQMVEIEGFIPLLLQRGDAGGAKSASSRLKRVCYMGDHNQLPPVIKNISFARFSNLDQSLFTRLIRLGVPYIQLDKQGRSRPELASLYSWRYDELGNLDHVTTADVFQLANAGLVHTMQLIDVDNFQGKGEISPSAYFWQNMGEAEYVVALFKYMVLIGHSPKTISILTTYNGQKQLIADILSQRCGEGTPLAGIRPRSVSTVDQFQGQQNEYILLSLVRTQSVGHLRDVRRLVVAFSRARLGLYVFCRQSLFGAVHDLKPAFDKLAEKPTKLELVLGEHYPSSRKASDKVPKGKVLELDDVSHLGAIVHQMQEDLINQKDE